MRQKWTLHRKWDQIWGNDDDNNDNDDDDDDTNGIFENSSSKDFEEARWPKWFHYTSIKCTSYVNCVFACSTLKPWKAIDWIKNLRPFSSLVFWQNTILQLDDLVTRLRRTWVWIPVAAGNISSYLLSNFFSPSYTIFWIKYFKKMHLYTHEQQVKNRIQCMLTEANKLKYRDIFAFFQVR